MDTQNLIDRITLNPKIMTGKPVIKGTRLTVDYILNLLGNGESVSEIPKEYKAIKEEDIKDCLMFATKPLENISFFAV